MRKRTLAIVIALVAALVTAACGNSTKSDSQALQTVKMGFAPDIFFAPLYIAKEKGFYEQQGIDAQITDFASGVEAGQALVTNQIDMTAETQNLGVILPSTSDVRTIARYSNAGKWWALIARPGITNVKDLVGKKVATQTGAQGEQWYQQLLAHEGIDRSSITFEDIKFPQLIPALTRGDVDAIITFQPNVAKALQTAKDSTVIRWGSDDDLAPTLGFMVVGKSLAANTDLAKKVIAAVKASDEWISKNTDEAVDIISKKTGITDKDMLKQIVSQVDFSVGLTDADRARMQDTIDWLASNGKVTAGLTVDKVIVPNLVG